MKKLISILIIIFIVTGIGYGVYWYLNTKSDILSEEDLFATQSPITSFLVMGDEIAIGTYSGNIYVIGIDGNIVWHSKIDSNISGLEKDSSNNLMVCGIYFYLFDNNGKEIFTKGYKNYIGVKSEFLENGDIELLFQSLKDFSYLAVVTDKNGKTISTTKIPDLGESSSISMLKNGKLLFVGSRGEIYLLDNDGGIDKSIQVDNKNGDLHSVYAFVLPNDAIVYGYSFSIAENAEIPIYFQKGDKKKIVTVHSNINSVVPGGNSIVFATKEEFLTFSLNGDLIKRTANFGFIPMSYSENETSKLFMYAKTIENKDRETIYSIVLKSGSKSTAKFLFKSKTMPKVCLDTKSNVVFLIDKDIVKILYKK